MVAQLFPAILSWASPWFFYLHWGTGVPLTFGMDPSGLFLYFLLSGIGMQLLDLVIIPFIFLTYLNTVLCHSTVFDSIWCLFFCISFGWETSSVALSCGGTTIYLYHPFPGHWSCFWGFLNYCKLFCNEQPNK